MRIRRSYMSVITILAMLIVCIIIVNSLGFSWPLWAAIRSQQAKQLAQQLPTIQDSVLLESKDGIAYNRIQNCTIAHVELLYGTNSLSLKEVFDQYRASLQDQGWRIQFVTDKGITFETTHQTVLEIASLDNKRNFTESILERGKQNYITLYVIGVNMLIVPGAVREDCM